MAVYDVYYAMKPDYEYKKNQYYTVIADDRIEALRISFDKVPEAAVWGMVAESRICQTCYGLGCDYSISGEVVLCESCRASGYKPTTETAPTPVIERVQVSLWRDGKRKDLHTVRAFEVIERFEYNGTPYIKYQFTPTRAHTVKAEHTKVAA